MPSRILPVAVPSDTVARLLALRSCDTEGLADVIDRLARAQYSPLADEPRPNPRHELAPTPQGPRGKYRYNFLSEEGAADTLGELLADVLRRFSDLDTTFLNQYSQREGRTRRFLARNPKAIYPGREDLSEYTTMVCQGWWVGTNYSRKDVRRLLRAACQVAGLTWGVDLRVQI